MGLASVCSEVMVLLLLIHCLFVLSLFGWVDVVIGPCYALLSGLSLFDIWPRKNSWLLYFDGLFTSAVSCL